MKVSSSTKYLQLTFLILLCRFCLSLSEHIGTQINHLFLVSICTINLTRILLGNYLSNFFLKKGQYRLLKQTRREKFFDGILALSKTGTIVWSITGITQSLLISGNLFMSSIIRAIIISSSNQKQRNIMIVYGIMMILLGWLICFQSLIQPHNVQFSTIYFFIAGTFGAILLRRITNFQLTIKAKLNS